MGCVNSQFVKLDPAQVQLPKAPGALGSTFASLGPGGIKQAGDLSSLLDPAKKAKELAEGIKEIKQSFDTIRSGTVNQLRVTSVTYAMSDVVPMLCVKLNFVFDILVRRAWLG